MNQLTAHKEEYSRNRGDLYLAYELGNKEWKLAFTVGFGLKPWTIVFDLWSAFPKSVQKVFPGILIQYDHFHVMNQIPRYLKNALLQFRRQLKEAGLKDLQEEIWQHKWRLLKNMDRWTLQDHLIIEDLMKVYRGTVVEKVLLFRECLFQIINNVQSRQEAFQKRD